MLRETDKYTERAGYPDPRRKIQNERATPEYIRGWERIFGKKKPAVKKRQASR